MKTFAFLIAFTISFFSFGQKYKLIYSTKSLIGSHNLYHPLFEGAPVFNQFLKQNIFDDDIQRFHTNIDLNPLDRELLFSDTILKLEYGFLNDNGSLVPVSASTIIDTKGKSYTLYRNNNKTIHHLEHNFNLKDTTISGTVFFPDPLSSSDKVYGGNYTDDNDKTNSYLDNELKEVNIRASFENNMYLLENKHLKIVNQSSPDIQPTIKTDSIFNFNRSEIGFEEINALYHISRFADYLKDSIGFIDIMNYQIAVDVYALNGNDQSEFINSTSPPRLNFGQGGVDDAEDADVLIHEYAHAVSHSAAPGSLIGYERSALDEGFCDYWAAVYSKKLNENNYKEIFNWDGHNEFWEGRSIDHQRTYEEGLDGNKYIDGELFAAMLMDIRNNIEDTTADKIILQSVYSWYPNMTFLDAIEQIMKADTLLYNSENSGTIHWLACKRGFLTKNCENRTNSDFGNVKIDHYMLHEGILSFSKPIADGSVKIFTLEGKLIFSTILNGKQLKLPKCRFGIYLLQIDEFTKRLIINN